MRDLPLGERFDPAVGSEIDYLDVLYQIFLTDLVRGDLYWKTPDTRLSLRRQPEIEGRHAIFWHIVSGGSDIETERELDENRCVRIRWIRPILEQFNEDFPTSDSFTGGLAQTRDGGAAGTVWQPITTTTLSSLKSAKTTPS